MQLFVRIPVFTRAGQAEIEERLRSFYEWVQAEGNSIIHERYGFSGVSIQGMAPGQHFRLMTESQDPFWIWHPKDPAALAHKGLVVRLHLMYALDRVDSTDFALRDDAIFVLIDGSGAFHFSNLFILLDTILAPPRRDVVLGRRPNNETGMSAWRKAIEDFEHHLLLKRFGERLSDLCLSHAKLVDGQAGCWAIRLSSLRSLPLTAREYELEYDLLASTLSGNLRFAFTPPLNMAERRTTEFGGTEVDARSIGLCLRKLSFIRHKLGMSVFEVLSAIQEFIDDPSACDLPMEYIEAVRRLEL